MTSEETMTSEDMRLALDACIEIIKKEVNVTSNNVDYVPTRFPTDKIPQNEIDLLTHAWWLAEEAKKVIDKEEPSMDEVFFAIYRLGAVRGIIWSSVSSTEQELAAQNGEALKKVLEADKVVQEVPHGE